MRWEPGKRVGFGQMHVVVLKPRFLNPKTQWPAVASGTASSRPVVSATMPLGDNPEDRVEAAQSPALGCSGLSVAALGGLIRMKALHWIQLAPSLHSKSQAERVITPCSTFS